MAKMGFLVLMLKLVIASLFALAHGFQSLPSLVRLNGGNNICRSRDLRLHGTSAMHRSVRSVSTRNSIGSPVQMIFGTQTKNKESLKTKLLDLCDSCRRGLDTPSGSEKRQEILDVVQKLEALNEIRAPLTSPAINGEWTLRWTTSAGILGANRAVFLRPDPKRSIIQIIDAVNLKAKNIEPVDLAGIRFENSVEAELEPLSRSKCTVQFKKFNIGGLISFNAPASARGELDTTYLDSDMRISRGDRGNVFVLTKE